MNWNRHPPQNSSLKMSNETHETECRQLKANLEALLGEKQQLIIVLNQKHEENVRYHQEIQRLAAELAKEKSASNLANEENFRLQKQIESLQMEMEAVKANSESNFVELTNNLAKSDLERENLLAVRRKLEAEVQTRTPTVSAEEFKQLQDQLRHAILLKDRSVGELAQERNRSEQLVAELQDVRQRESKLAKEIERLRSHLMQIEENYTAEAVKAEERETTLRAELREAEAKLFNASTQAKDSAEQLTENVADLEVQLGSLAKQRDAALLELSDVQDQLKESRKATANLQQVLQHFQQERDSLAFDEVDKYKKELRQMNETKKSLETRIRDLESELERANGAFFATAAISQQLAQKDAAIEKLRSECDESEQRNMQLQARCAELQKVQNGRIEKELVKNLLMGYFTAPAHKKPEVAHLLGSIMGFSAEDFQKVEGGSSSWLNFVRGSGTAGPKSADQSIAEQFVLFLEKESSPKPSPVALPVVNDRRSSRSSTPGGSTGSGSTSGRTLWPPSSVGFQLPTFAPANSADVVKDLLLQSEPQSSPSLTPKTQDI